MKHRKDVTTSGREQLCSVSVQLGAGVVHPRNKPEGRVSFQVTCCSSELKERPKTKTHSRTIQ